MTKYDYLTRLKHYLQPLPIKERTAAIKYYDKYFTDAGPENEQNVILQLGDPKSLAERIIHNDKHSFSGMIHETRKNLKNIQSKMDKSQQKMSCLFAIILFPIWGGIIFLFLLTLAFFAMCVFGIFAFLEIAGVILLFMSFPYIFNLTSVGLVLMGLSLVMMSIPVLVFFPAARFVLFFIKKAVEKSIGLFNTLISRKAEIKK